LNTVPRFLYKAPAGTVTVDGLRSTFLNSSPHKAPCAGGQTADFSNRQHRDHHKQLAIALPQLLMSRFSTPYSANSLTIAITTSKTNGPRARAQVNSHVLYLHRRKIPRKGHPRYLRIVRDIPPSLQPTKIGNFKTDGDLTSGQFVTLIVEFKNDVGWSGAEP
jgi:hypothetical protein